MKSYTKPDLERPIEELRAEIQRDYEALVTNAQLPHTLGFEAAVAATKLGMVSPRSYPFKDFQSAFADFIARHSGNEDTFIDAFEIMTGVWNHFPHDDLGMSPVEKMREEVAAGAPPIDYDALLEEENSPENEERIQKAIDQRLQFLSEVAEENLLYFLRTIGGTKKDLKAITAIFTDPTRDPSDALTYLLVEMPKARPNKKVTYADMQPVVRALTMGENHLVSVMKNGHQNSRLFQEMVRQCVNQIAASLEENAHSGKASGSLTLIEPIEVLDTLLDTHAEISVLARRLRIAEGLKDAAHHILDWLVLTDINEIFGYNPKERAAHILAVARLIAATGDPKRPFTTLEPKLQAASGYADSNAFKTEIARLAEFALIHCGDPRQMMPIPGQEPDDCEKRLTALAPSLAFRSPILPDDLSTPSPFF